MNSTQFRGNASRLFDMNDRIGENKNNEPLMPLVPHGMKWDQHDSVKYAHINYQERESRAELLPPNTTELRNQQ